MEEGFLKEGLDSFGVWDLNDSCGGGGGEGGQGRVRRKKKI